LQPHAAEGTLRACWRMVWADGKMGNKERELLLDWGQKLG
jgi:DnaJ like chaperone protein